MGDEEEFLRDVAKTIAEAQEALIEAGSEEVTTDIDAYQEIVAFLLLHSPQARLRIFSKFCSVCGELLTSDHRCGG